MVDLEGNDMLTKERYLADPCKAASIPYWKAKSITVPDGMKILHQDEYDNAGNKNFIDEPYFRVIHNLKSLAEPVLPQGYSLCAAAYSTVIIPRIHHGPAGSARNSVIF